MELNQGYQPEESNLDKTKPPQQGSVIKTRSNLKFECEIHGEKTKCDRVCLTVKRTGGYIKCKHLKVSHINTGTEVAKPNLGCATTRELIGEITARIEVDGNLDYKTIDSD